MENIKNYTFDYGAETEFFWNEGKNYKELDAALNISIEQAYKDIMVRTLKVKDCEKSTDIIKKLKEENSLKTHIKEYLETKNFSETFDSFHNRLCQSALNCLKQKYEKVEYGKAQKLVNMTFKYLYCTQYVKNNNKKDFFEDCHIALDSIILEWLYNYVYDEYEIDNNEVKRREKNSNKPKLTRDGTPSWSNLTYSDNENLVEKNKYTYNFYIQIIRKYFKDKNINITPFQAEFIIWREMQMELAANEFLISLKKYYKNDINPTNLIRDKSVTEQINCIKNHIQ